MEKSFAVRHGRSDAILEIGHTDLTCTMGGQTAYRIPRNTIRFCAMSARDAVTINTEHGGAMKTITIRSRHARLILDALT